VPAGRAAAAAGALVAFGVAGTAIAAAGAGSSLYSLTFSPWYQALVLVLVAAVLAEALGAWNVPAGASGAGFLTAWRRRLHRAAELSPLRWAAFLGTGLVVFYPVFRCFFAVPWLFCHACPRPCVFGLLRPYLVPAALLINLQRRHWCQAACPLGTLHQCQAGLSRRPHRLRRPLTWLAYAVLALVVLAYFKVPADRADPGGGVLGDWYAALYLDAFAVVPGVLAVAAVLLLAGFRWLRPFCDLLCPVGTLSRLFLKVERRWWSRVPAEEAGRAV